MFKADIIQAGTFKVCIYQVYIFHGDVFQAGIFKVDIYQVDMF